MLPTAFAQIAKHRNCLCLKAAMRECNIAPAPRSTGVLLL
jgi:hypothetical protein